MYSPRWLLRNCSSNGNWVTQPCPQVIIFGTKKSQLNIWPFSSKFWKYKVSGQLQKTEVAFREVNYFCECNLPMNALLAHSIIRMNELDQAFSWSVPRTSGPTGLMLRTIWFNYTFEYWSQPSHNVVEFQSRGTTLGEILLHRITSICSTLNYMQQQSITEVCL
jgi:hypothetical protein